MQKRYRIDCAKWSQDEEENCSTQIQMDDIIEELFIKTRRIMVIGQIDEVVSTHVCSYLQLFSLRKDPIYMYINSPGGNLDAGYAIIDQMLMCSCPIHTIIRGQGCSLGAIIAAFGTKGLRHATPNSIIMLHSLMMYTSSDSIEKHAEMLCYFNEDYKSKVADISKRMRVTYKQLYKLMGKTSWLTPPQAIKIGLIDNIWTPKMEKAVSDGLTI